MLKIFKLVLSKAPTGAIGVDANFLDMKQWDPRTSKGFFTLPSPPCHLETLLLHAPTAAACVKTEFGNFLRGKTNYQRALPTTNWKMHKTPLECETSNSRFYLIKGIISVTFGNLSPSAPFPVASRGVGKQTLWCNFRAWKTSSNDAKITKTTAIIYMLSPTLANRNM